jgi:hypothetical protein
MTAVCYALAYYDVFIYNLKAQWRSVVAYSLQVLSTEEMYIMWCPLHLLWMELETSVWHSLKRFICVMFVALKKVKQDGSMVWNNFFNIIYNTTEQRENMVRCPVWQKISDKNEWGMWRIKIPNLSSSSDSVRKDQLVYQLMNPWQKPTILLQH